MVVPKIDESAIHAEPIKGIEYEGICLLLLATPVQFIFGSSFYVSAFKSIIHCGLNMDVLVVMGTTAAYFYSVLSMVLHYFDNSFKPQYYFDTSVMLITIILFGRFLSSIAEGKTSDAITKLLELCPDTTILLELLPNGEYSELVVDLSSIKEGDRLKVLPGQTIPTDGELVLGITTVDESMLTGESLPITKEKGSLLIGGSMNQTGMIHMIATSVGSDTALSKIIQLVEDAQTSKAPIQVLADKISSVFVPIVISLCGLTFAIWITVSYTVVPESWLNGENPFVFSFFFALSVLVIACPCSLGLATPTAVMVGTGIGARFGILVKGGEPLESAHKLSCLVFDKTGTLTKGTPTVTNICYSDSFKKNYQSEHYVELMKLMYLTESGSQHPISTAIVKYLSKELSGKKVEDIKLEDVKIVGGKGIMGAFTVNMPILLSSCSNLQVFIGNRLFMKENELPISNEINEMAHHLEKEGKTCVFVAIKKDESSRKGKERKLETDEDQVLACVSIADMVKEESQDVIYALNDMGISVYMLTGDNKHTALAIGESIGLSPNNIFYEVLPKDKARQVEQLQSQGFKVGMVGDGTNDSPALVTADVGFAIGTGTDVAIEAADIVLMKSDLWDVVTAIDLSKKTFNRIRWNFFWALLYNVLAVPIAGGVLYPIIRTSLSPVVAGMAMSLSSICVVASSLLLRLYKKPNYEKYHNSVNNSVEQKVYVFGDSNSVGIDLEFDDGEGVEMKVL